ncbi:DUF6210 family protein [Pseudomaricurvus sp.]|uniref:DUF6210 family protein n=1 Tax=Pseudomaricurvus sp. TaxID=2004510 RepID=UPI003F6BD623
MKKVCLYSLEQPGIIVLSPSGVLYWNKSGDTDPAYQAEGILVPISNDPPQDQPELSLVPRLQALMDNEGSLNQSQAREIDDFLHEVSSSDSISVDLSKVSQSSTGWVHLSIRPQGDYSYFEGFSEEGEALQAVLTWPCRVEI